MDSETPQAPATTAGQEISLFLQAFGLVFSQSSIYGVDHSVTAGSMKKSYSAVVEMLEGRDAVNFAVSDEQMVIDGIPYQGTLPVIKQIAERLNRLEIASFSIVHGIPEQEYNGLVELLHSEPDEMKKAGGFSQVVSMLGMQHVRAKKVILKQITEDEVVVSKEKLDAALGGADTAQVMAVLRGEIPAGSDRAANVTLQAAVADTHKLAELVVAAAVPAEGASLEQKSEQIAGSVRHLYDHLAQSPQAKTQKGKKELTKALDQLEHELVDQLKTGAGGDGGPAVETAVSKISESIGEMKDELAIDALAVEYAKKISAIQASQKRILRYMNTKGGVILQDKALMEKLMGGGLSPEGWEELVEKSDLGDGAGGLKPGMVDTEEPPASREEALAAIQALSASLAKLEGVVISEHDSMGAAPEPSAVEGGLHVAVEDISGRVGQITEHTEQKIERFVRSVKKARASGEPGGMSRRKIVEFLAEIVQELRQPLAVIMSSVTAIKAGMLGAVTRPQDEMLGLAVKSADRLDALTDKLLEISGLPTALRPDQKILRSVYDGAAPNESKQG